MTPQVYRTRCVSKARRRKKLLVALPDLLRLVCKGDAFGYRLGIGWGIGGPLRPLGFGIPDFHAAFVKKRYPERREKNK